MSKIFVQVSLKDDAYERQLERVDLLYNVYTLCWQCIRDRQQERECLLYVYKTNRVV